MLNTLFTQLRYALNPFHPVREDIDMEEAVWMGPTELFLGCHPFEQVPTPDLAILTGDSTTGSTGATGRGDISFTSILCNAKPKGNGFKGCLKNGWSPLSVVYRV